jgi:SAM-dependent methyltransferase
MVKRKYDSFVEPSTNSSEWLMEGMDAINYVYDILLLSSISKESLILMPGCGISIITKLLYDKGYKNLYIIDLEDRSISFQQELFKDVNGDVVIKKHDILNDKFPSNIMFDVIIDKSFMDVFLRQNGATLVWNNIIPLLKQGGLYVALSMFHKKWKRYVNLKIFAEVKYGSVITKKFSRTRPTIANFSQQACILACIKKNEEKKGTTFNKVFTVLDTTFSDLHSVPTYSFPNDSSMF